MKASLLVALLAAATSLAAEEKLGSPDDLPSIGPYMLTIEDGQVVPAHWLGARYEGKILREPINIIIRDELSEDEGAARERLLAACVEAGFPLREGHSSGYFALVDGNAIPQFAPKPHHAFSDAPFELNNNHGRIFGPYRYRGAYWFAAAFSREDVAPLRDVKHRYDSFNRARYRFSESMNAKTGYVIARYANLGNAILRSEGLSTGDHDGIAVVLEAR